ncbi:MAG: hypothetical protein WCR36_01340 [Bacteroidaceae bacterium]
MSNRMKVKTKTDHSKESEGSAHHSNREERKGLRVVRGIFIALIILAIASMVIVSLNQ